MRKIKPLDWMAEGLTALASSAGRPAMKTHMVV